MIRVVVIAALIVLALVPVVSFANTNLTRQEIKSMPITERPHRTGHFYGNTVRRMDRRR